jgi:NAD(P)-dependent dehydrogenase (short-subunit alcohol dehydrogenase family)
MRSTLGTFPTRAAKLTLAAGAGLAAKEAISRRREADLTGQVALITGGSRGLGLAIARELAAEGCRLAICARDTDQLERIAAELRDSGAEVITITCDVGHQDEVEAMVAQGIDHYGHIDLLFTVAGEVAIGQARDMELEDIRRAMDVMFWGIVYPVLAVLPSMRERGYGRIAAVTSIGGKIAVPHMLSYSAAKFAAVGFTEGLSAELASEGIHVTTLAPGLMRTGSHLHARFKGSDAQQEGDYAWFSAGASQPLAARADRAARIMVRAVKRGETERIQTLPFSLAARFHGVAPALTIRLMRVANAVLPSHDARPGDISIQPGEDIEQRLDSTLQRAATVLGKEAAEAFRQPPATESAASGEG